MRSWSISQDLPRCLKSMSLKSRRKRRRRTRSLSLPRLIGKMDAEFTRLADAGKVEVSARLNELRAEQERLRRVRQLKQEYGINFYRPHAKQDRFHRAGHKVGRYVRTGNRGEKRSAGLRRMWRGVLVEEHGTAIHLM